MFAADYPFIDVFWSMLIFFFWVIWIWILVTVLIDVFRRHDLSGWGKAAWALFMIVLPYLGVFIYLITQGKEMAERRAAEVRESQASFDTYVRDVAGSGAPRRPSRSRRPRSCSTRARSTRPSSRSSSRRLWRRNNRPTRGRRAYG